MLHLLTILSQLRRWPRLDWRDYLRVWCHLCRQQVSHFFRRGDIQVVLFYVSTCNETNLLLSPHSQYYSQCLPGGSGGGGGGSSPTTTTAQPQPTNGNGGGGSSGGSGLHNKFKAKGKLYYGTEIDHYHLSKSAITNIVKSDFGQITCENSMKWDAIERKSKHLLLYLKALQLTMPVLQLPVAPSATATPMPSSTSLSRTAS